MFRTNDGATTAGNLMQSRSRFWGLSIGGKCVLQLAFFGFGLCIMGILPLAVASKFEGRAGTVNVPRVIGIIFLSVGLLFLVGGVICLLVIAKYAKHDPGGGHSSGNYAVVDLYANQPSVHYHTSGERLGNMQGPLEARTCPYGVSTIYAPSPDASQTSREEGYNQAGARAATGGGYQPHSQYQQSSPIYVPYKSSPQRSLACSNPSAHYVTDDTQTPDSPKPAIHVLRPPSYRTASNAPLTCTHSPPPAYSESRYNA